MMPDYSGELREALKGAEAIAKVEGAPSVRVEHFLLALVGVMFPGTWRGVLEILARQEGS